MPPPGQTQIAPIYANAPLLQNQTYYPGASSQCPQSQYCGYNNPFSNANPFQGYQLPDFGSGLTAPPAIVNYSAPTQPSQYSTQTSIFSPLPPTPAPQSLNPQSGNNSTYDSNRPANDTQNLAMTAAAGDLLKSCRSQKQKHGGSLGESLADAYSRYAMDCDSLQVAPSEALKNAHAVFTGETFDHYRDHARSIAANEQQVF